MNIKELAEQAGIGSLYEKNLAYSNELIRFAELVRQDEREICSKLLIDFSNTTMVPVVDTFKAGLRAGSYAIISRGDKHD